MANMSYCRFHNTSLDMKDCIYAIQDGQEISDEEKRYARMMFEEIADFMIECGAIDSYDDQAMNDIIDNCNEYYGEEGEEDW